MGLVTNGFSEVQRSRIARLGLEKYFDAVAISGEIGVGKPDAGIFDFVFESLGSPSKETTVMVGDNLSADIAGGANYGLSTCWYNPTRRARERAFRIDHELSDLGNLLSLVAR
jgi:HAD superfamily hydrolase (TIGR01509 family)